LFSQLHETDCCDNECFKAFSPEEVYLRTKALSSMSTEEKRRYIYLDLLSGGRMMARGKQCVETR
jgi:hypothetical protein